MTTFYLFVFIASIFRLVVSEVSYCKESMARVFVRCFIGAGWAGVFSCILHCADRTRVSVRYLCRLGLVFCHISGRSRFGWVFYPMFGLVGLDFMGFLFGVLVGCKLDWGSSPVFWLVQVGLEFLWDVLIGAGWATILSPFLVINQWLVQVVLGFCPILIGR